MNMLTFLNQSDGGYMLTAVRWLQSSHCGDIGARHGNSMMKCLPHTNYQIIHLYWYPYYKHANHMTTRPDYLKTKGNVNIKLWNLYETLIVYILLSTFHLVHMVLNVNKPDVKRFIAWMESADWNPCTTTKDFSHIQRLWHIPLELLPNIKGSHDLDYIES